MTDQPQLVKVLTDEQGRIIGTENVDPNPYDRIRMSYQACELEWRYCQDLVAQVTERIEDPIGVWHNTLSRMQSSVSDILFLRLMALLEDALTIAIETHAPGRVTGQTLNEKLRFLEDLKVLGHPRELHLLKRARNEFLHSFHAAANMEAEVAFNIIAAELDHLGFGPIPRRDKV